MGTNLLYERKCALNGCNNTFCIHGEDWAYKDITRKDYTRYFCSWKHLQQYRNEIEEAKAAKKRQMEAARPKREKIPNSGRKRNPQTELIVQELRNKEEISRIAERFGMTQKQIMNYRYKYREEIEGS